MVFWKFKSQREKRKTPTEQKLIMEEKIQEKLNSEISEVFSIFTRLSDRWKEACMRLLAQPRYTLIRTHAETWDEIQNENINKIISMISHRDYWTKDEVATRLSTQYNIEKVFLNKESMDKYAWIEHLRERQQPRKNR